MNPLPTPPAYVPTLTDIVHPALSQEAVNEHAAAGPADTSGLQALMVQRVLRQMDGVLERRLHEAIGQLVREHVQALLPRLLDEIEQVVRESVNQAFEGEMSVSPVQPGNLKSTLS